MPAVQYGHHIDLDFNELRNARIQAVAGLPTPVPERAGWIVFNTVDARLYVCTGSAWELRATDSDKLGAQLPAWYRDRANHTGTQSASTITGLTAAIEAVPLSDLAPPTGPVDLDGQRLINVGNATADTDAPNWGQVKDFVNLQDFRAARVASTANIDVASTGNGAVMDGVTLATGDIVLLRNQTSAPQNGLYVVQATNMVRDPDANTAEELPPGLIVVIEEGTTQANDMFMNTTPPGYVMGTDPITFSPYGQAPTPLTAGNGISIISNVISAVAATGITVGPGGIGVDFTVVSRYFEVIVPVPGSGTAVPIVHSLGRSPVPYTVMEVASKQEITVGAEFTDDNTITLDFAIAPVSGQYKIAVG